MKKGNSIRYSFTKQEDLNRVVERLGDLVHHVKIPEKQEGKYKTAYIVLKQN